MRVKISSAWELGLTAAGDISDIHGHTKGKGQNSRRGIIPDGGTREDPDVGVWSVTPTKFSTKHEDSRQDRQGDTLEVGQG